MYIQKSMHHARQESIQSTLFPVKHAHPHMPFFSSWFRLLSNLKVPQHYPDQGTNHFSSPPPENCRLNTENYRRWRFRTGQVLMSDVISLRFESRLRAPAEAVWSWLTSVRGIRAEMWPWLFMTVPKGLRSIEDIEIRPGQRMFRSYVFLFGVLPIDYSDMTLLELKPGEGLLEESPMGSMKLWRHKRYIEPCPTDPDMVMLVDELAFQPRLARRLTAWFIRRVFNHRHKVLRARLSTGQEHKS